MRIASGSFEQAIGLAVTRYFGVMKVSVMQTQN